MNALGKEMEQLVNLMHHSLVRYTQGEMTLQRLVSDIESCIDSLAEVADNEWVEELRSEWWHLEYAYAISTDEERPLTDDEQASVSEAITALEAMLVAY